MGMAQNECWSIQDNLSQPCPTSKVEHLNPIQPYGVGINMPTPPELEISIPIMHHHHTKKDSCLVNGGMCKKVLKFGHNTMPRF
jgi:hypothetical protein